jgi:hypothetical protein
MNEQRAEEVEFLVHGFAAREPVLPLRQDCPDPADIYEAAAGRLEHEQRLRIVDHATVCAECARAWRLAADLQPVRRAALEVRFPARRLGMLAAAASVVVAAGVFFILQPAQQTPPGYRDGGSLAAPESRLEQSVMPRDAFRLRWSPGPPGATYTLRLTDTTLTPVLVETGIAASEFEVPREALDSLDSGSRLYWQVEMRLAGGTRAVSPTYPVVLQ